MESEMGPSWLMELLKAKFFIQCSVHADLNKNEGKVNMFCLDCMGDAFCHYCLSNHNKNHHVLQIRRSSYRNVVRVDEIQMHLDISCIQTYIINSATVVFLYARTQTNHGKGRKGVTATCQTCCRGVLESFKFCSLACKLQGIKRGDDDESLTFTLKPINKYLNKRELAPAARYDGSNSGETVNPKKLRKVILDESHHVTNIPSAGYTFIRSPGRGRRVTARKATEGYQYGGKWLSYKCPVAIANTNNIFPSTKPIYNHYNARKRKGIPRRAPLV